MSEKDSVPSRLWDTVTALSDNAQLAATRKAQELGFDLNAGEIPFEETLLNLSHNRDVLRDAIEKGRIVQLPLRLQYRLLTEATKVKTQLESLVSGSDAVLSTENAVEDLTATIWQLNLQNLSDQILAFDAKMGQLKNQEAQIAKLLNSAKKIGDALTEIQKNQAEAQSYAAQIAAIDQDAAKRRVEIDATYNSAAETEKKIKAAESVVQAHEANIAKASSTSTEAAAALETASDTGAKRLHEIEEQKRVLVELGAASQKLKEETEAAILAQTKSLSVATESLNAELKDEVGTLVASTKASLDEEIENKTAQMEEATTKVSKVTEAFQAEMASAEALRAKNASAQLTTSAATFTETLKAETEKYSTLFSEIEENARGIIKENNEESKRLTEYLATLEARIHDSIERATGYTLFHSFQARQLELQKSKSIWSIALGVCVVISVCVSFWFMHSVASLHQFNAMLLMKLAISIPIIFAITFCGVQYSRERRLEEEYAFKSSISISLEPYRKLVGELIDKNQPTEVAKYTEFLISSINKVFTSPTVTVFDGDQDGDQSTGNLLKTAGNVAESLIKAKIK